jgi:hypothetical protein
MDESAQACWRRIFPFPSKDCSIVQLLEATGVSSTLADGKRVFQVSDVVCPQGAFWSLGEPINVDATPLSERPIFLTMTYSLTSQGTDPSFNPDDVVFDWRCVERLYPSPSWPRAERTSQTSNKQTCLAAAVQFGLDEEQRKRLAGGSVREALWLCLTSMNGSASSVDRGAAFEAWRDGYSVREYASEVTAADPPRFDSARCLF